MGVVTALWRENLCLFPTSFYSITSSKVELLCCYFSHTVSLCFTRRKRAIAKSTIYNIFSFCRHDWAAKGETTCPRPHKIIAEAGSESNILLTTYISPLLESVIFNTSQRNFYLFYVAVKIEHKKHTLPTSFKTLLARNYIGFLGLFLEVYKICIIYIFCLFPTLYKN